MLGPPTIFSLMADSQKHEVTSADSATRTRASIAPIKDIFVGKTIGCCTRRGKLYYVEWAPYGETNFTTIGTCSKEERGKVWLWHKRLVHVLFGYHKKLFPSLFYSLDVSSFQCDMCELAKSHRVPFPLNSNKSLVPFSLVHSDVCGPDKIATPAGARWFVTFVDDCTSMT
ncbi:hypothetical protein L3X38_044139 [Prunus dulcis]|uniref:GAG-pre-integrase domain-containing protein n=1 Tax=Prunus dulcis TaxID=3755 RepID=A0AAD4YNM3_PRUDU|nr:hypothetical protein L3X38_044139 [Prunus dulcis]